MKEFATLCDSKDEDTVKEVSIPWITQYVNLCKDNEPRIREGVQKAMRSYLSRVQRNVAPFLKRFFAHWFVAQFDTHPPTASVAASTFEVSLTKYLIKFNLEVNVKFHDYRILFPQTKELK